MHKDLVLSRLCMSVDHLSANHHNTSTSSRLQLPNPVTQSSLYPKSLPLDRMKLPDSTMHKYWQSSAPPLDPRLDGFNVEASTRTTPIYTPTHNRIQLGCYDIKKIALPSWPSLLTSSGQPPTPTEEPWKSLPPRPPKPEAGGTTRD